MGPLYPRWPRLTRLILLLSAAVVFGCYLVPVHRLGIWRITSERQLVRQRNYKYILQWNSYFDFENLELGHFDGNIFEEVGCPRTDCVFTDNHMNRLLPAEEYDAVLFHMYYFWLSPLRLLMGTLPARRSPHQRYIFFILEAPPMAGISFKNTGGLFNWTMTYRRDSDIVWPYAEFVPLGDTPALAQGWLPAPAAPIAPSAAATLHAVNSSRPQGDKALVAWLVSNCHTQSRREDYVRELSKHIRVDVFGKCATRPWPKDDVEGFYRMLSANYTFYLSFENSLCRDYVTEKFFKVLPLDVVPVVYGGANYSAIAPPHSYIDARDFASPRHLARYLRFLARRPQELAKFSWWKRHYRVVAFPASSLCRLCSRLHDPGPEGAYADVERWYSGPDVCQQPRIHWDTSAEEAQRIN